MVEVVSIDADHDYSVQQLVSLLNQLEPMHSRQIIAKVDIFCLIRWLIIHKFKCKLELGREKD